MSDLLNIEKRRKSQDAEEDKENKQLLSDIKEVFDNEVGIRVLGWVLSLGCIFDDTFHLEYSHFLEGKRSVGLEILDKIMEADKEIFVKIIRKDW